MNYPTREQVKLLIEYCEMNDMTLIKKGCLDAIAMLDEIDRLTHANELLTVQAFELHKMLPKVVVPKFDGDYYNCDCGQTVGDILYDVTNPYCVSCGARMDWDKVVVQGWTGIRWRWRGERNQQYNQVEAERKYIIY
jgi:hypothetical protein